MVLMYRGSGPKWFGNWALYMPFQECGWDAGMVVSRPHSIFLSSFLLHVVKTSTNSFFIPPLLCVLPDWWACFAKYIPDVMVMNILTIIPGGVHLLSVFWHWRKSSQGEDGLVSGIQTSQVVINHMHIWEMPYWRHWCWHLDATTS